MPAKSLIPNKYNNSMELNKLKRKKYFTEALLSLVYQGFSWEEVSICANITASAENLIVWYKALTAYGEGDALHIKFNTGHPNMVGKW